MFTLAQLMKPSTHPSSIISFVRRNLDTWRVMGPVLKAALSLQTWSLVESKHLRSCKAISDCFDRKQAVLFAATGVDHPIRSPWKKQLKYPSSLQARNSLIWKIFREGRLIISLFQQTTTFRLKRSRPFIDLTSKTTLWLSIFTYINGSRVMRFSTRRIVRGEAICPPLRKPTRTYAIGVKITGGLEVVNSSTKMQFQVNWGIFEEVRPVWILRKSNLCVAANQN